MLISSPSPARDGCRKSNVNAKAPKRRNWLRILSGHLPQAQPLPRLGYTSTAASKSCLGQRCTQILQDTELLRTRLQHLALTDSHHPHKDTAKSQEALPGGSTDQHEAEAVCPEYSRARRGRAWPHLAHHKATRINVCPLPFPTAQKADHGTGHSSSLCTEQPEGSQNCWRCLPGPGCDKGEQGPQQAPSSSSPGL